VAGVGEGPPQCLRGPAVGVAAGAHERRRSDVEGPHHGGERGHLAGAEISRVLSVGAGGALDGLAVLIAAHGEPDIVAAQPAMAGEHIAADLLVGVAEMRIAVDVVDRRGDVEGLWWGHVNWLR